MKKLFLLLLLAVPCYGEGPQYRNKDKTVQLEFENVYQDLRRIPNSFIQNSTINQAGASFNVSSGTISNEFRVSSSTTGDLFYVGRSSVTVGKSGAPAIIYGTQTNDDAAAGIVGQSTISVNVALLTTSSYTTITSLFLSPQGDWDVSAVCQSSAAASAIEVTVGITATINSGVGHLVGDGAIFYPVSGTFDGAGSIPNFRINNAAPTTYYITGKSFGASIVTRCRLSARRVR